MTRSSTEEALADCLLKAACERLEANTDAPVAPGWLKATAAASAVTSLLAEVTRQHPGDLRLLFEAMRLIVFNLGGHVGACPAAEQAGMLRVLKNEINEGAARNNARRLELH